jgi:hypothetical protein
VTSVLTGRRRGDLVRWLGDEPSLRNRLAEIPTASAVGSGEPSAFSRPRGAGLAGLASALASPPSRAIVVSLAR